MALGRRRDDGTLWRVHLFRRRLRALIAVTVAALLCLPAAHAQKVLNVGLVPAEDPRLVVTDNQVMLDQLSKSLGMQIKPFVATDYNGVIEALRAKRLDIALLGPFSYVLATSIAPVEAFVIPETQKQGATYQAYIIARKDRGIRTLAQLKDKTFAFVDPSSTSGHLFPKAGLIKAGFDPDTLFSRVIFSGGHDASAIAVQNGKVDAAAVADALLESAMSRNMVKPEDVVIVWKSQPIPGAPFVMRKDLPEDLKARLRLAFAQMKDVPWGPNATIKRWIAVDDAHYDVVRDTARLLKLDIKKLK
jgi:phosphonate transport system substrate-binding protein